MTNRIDCTDYGIVITISKLFIQVLIAQHVATGNVFIAELLHIQ